jgi:hypothetical protein
VARNINSRLNQLKTRRHGTDRLGRLALDAQLEVLAKSLQTEDWQKRASYQPNTQYALGAMQEVGPEYTRISIETAERVGKQLSNSISLVEFRLQGSVPLNVHIRGVSDVDLLTLDTGFLVYDRFGVGSQGGAYTQPTPRTSLGVLSTLRSNVERVLPVSFPAADVDTSGGKAVSISGGSLARPVDVVPSHWYDTAAYQQSRQQHDRAIHILNKKTAETIENYPFLHIKRVSDRCAGALGGLRKAIRLCKNVKADAIEEGTSIPFPSFDIAAVMYHADMQALTIGSIYELKILAETQRFLDVLYHNEVYAKSLRTPDDLRVIIDTQEKYEGLKKLSIEMDDLLKEVAKEQKPGLILETGTALQSSRDAISVLKVA